MKINESNIKNIIAIDEYCDVPVVREKHGEKHVCRVYISCTDALLSLVNKDRVLYNKSAILPSNKVQISFYVEFAACGNEIINPQKIYYLVDSPSEYSTDFILLEDDEAELVFQHLSREYSMEYKESLIYGESLPFLDDAEYLEKFRGLPGVGLSFSARRNNYYCNPGVKTQKNCSDSEDKDNFQVLIWDYKSDEPVLKLFGNY